MTAGTAWMSAFPMANAESAVGALLESWAQMACKHRPKFNPTMPEHKLTRVVRAHVRKHAAGKRLLGYWGTEGVENDVDFETGEILGEGRTDVAYHWNDPEHSYTLIFEFKKLKADKTSRRFYIEGGLQKFVTGLYSEQQPLALMVGILMAPEADAVAGLKRALAMPATAALTQACQDAHGRFILEPSVLFPPHATFDTEHVRTPEKAPAHGTIRIGHAFVTFPYAVFPAKRARGARIAAVEADETTD